MKTGQEPTSRGDDSDVVKEEKGGKSLVPFEESKKKASDILERFKTELQQYYQAAMYMSEDDEKREGIWNTKNGTDAISGFLEKVPGEVKEKFYGHGITKGSAENRLAAFLNIIENKTIKGEFGPLGSGAYSAYTDAQFFIISHCEQPLCTYISDAKGNRDVEANAMGWVANVGAFVVNYDYYPIVDELKRMFPDARIIRANELADYINSEIGS